LEERRSCTAGDLQILHLYAEQHARWTRARAKVAELGEVMADTRLTTTALHTKCCGKVLGLRLRRKARSKCMPSCATWD
jgi:hypothetical protein